MNSIHPDLFPIASLASNCYVIRGAQGALLVDTGLKGNIRAIGRALKAAGLEFRDLQFILITHADGDHYGSLAALKALAPQAIACASQHETDAMQTGRMSREMKAQGFQKVLYDSIRPLFKSPPVKVDRVIGPGERFSWLGSLVTLDSKGHTPGHLSFYSESTGILFAGDSVLVHGRELVPAHGANCWDEALGREAFERQLALKPKSILGGHGVWLG